MFNLRACFNRRSSRRVLRESATACLLTLSIVTTCPAASRPASAPAHKSNVRAASSADEARAEHAYAEALKAGPLALRAFLYRMPKGSDLHMHLSGAVYAESFLRAAGEDGLCIDTHALSFQKPAGSGEPASSCADGAVAAASVTKNQHLYDALIDSFSMRSFVPSNGNSGHDHFFDTFDKFGGTSKSHLGEWIDEIASRAAAQNEQYLELMHTPDFSEASALAMKAGFHSDFAEYRRLLLEGGLKNAVPGIQSQMDEAEAKRRNLEHCGAADAQPACAVQVRYVFQVLRGLPKEVVFAQTLLAFEVASADPRFVGLNFVMPEDGFISMTDYRLHMQMLDALHGFYPKVHISLHAGELAPGMVPWDGLNFHIRAAVEQGHAERIGHGVDVMYEEHPYDLLREMAARHVMVEINLTSNDVILGIRGRDHPLPIYLQYGVPVALSTDDEGVSRIDLTTEYVRAADTYRLSYRELKQMVRTGLEHSFLPGASLWQQTGKTEDYDHPVTTCRSQLGRPKAMGECASFLQSNEKAGEEWELEARFHAFEASL